MRIAVLSDIHGNRTAFTAVLADLKLEPRDAGAHHGMGRIFQLELQFERTRAEFQRSIDLQPVQTEAYYELGNIARGQGEVDNAIAYFSKTLARYPKHGGALAGTAKPISNKSNTPWPKNTSSEPLRPLLNTRPVINWALH